MLIVGRTASIGSARGIVRVVRDMEDASLLQAGEVLCAPMTTPDMVPAMRRAAAFITRDGGITCHAAVVAREWGVPCIVGVGPDWDRLRTGQRVEIKAMAGRGEIMVCEG